ncbi:MAG: ABC transporter permease [Phaeodactylibacter sp.]|nr:ABC transporter permease [Phaeodactylibacter sp.]MCB9272813.1 ABC transporter permease [Lewinellaceae bacterium]
MKQLLIFIRKETYHIFRDKRTLLILLGMPMVQVLLFGFAITNEITNARIAILDQSKGEMSRNIIQRFTASGYFEIDENLQSLSDIERHFRQGKTKLVAVFPPQLEENMKRNVPAKIQLVADATDPNTATTLINYASAIIGRYLQEQSHGQAVPLAINTEVKMLYNPRLKSVYMFVPGVITIILMLMSAMMTSIAITREKELGTMEVLLVSPLRPSTIIIGKVIPYIVLALAMAAIVLLLGAFVFNMPIRGSLVLLIAECVLFVITSLSLGILISTRTETQQVAMLISLMALMLPTILLSGFIFPIESMPKVLQILSNIIPAKWFIIIIKNVMLRGTGFSFIWKETLILLGMAMFFIAASIRNFKIRLA